MPFLLFLTPRSLKAYQVELAVLRCCLMHSTRGIGVQEPTEMASPTMSTVLVAQLQHRVPYAFQKNAIIA